MIGGLWLRSTLLVWLLAASAQAQPKPAEQGLTRAIEVAPGATCLTQTRVVGHVRMWLGRDAVDADLHVRVRGDAENARALSFDIVRGGEVRHRDFAAAPASCDDLHAVVGLSIALAIDAELLADIAPPVPASAARLRRFAVALAGANEILPDLSIGGDAGIELGLLPWLSARIDAFGQYSFDDAITGSRGTFDALLIAGSLQVCAGGRPDPKLRLGLCVGPASGAVHAQGHGYEPNRAATGFWLAIRSGARVELQVGIPWVIDIDVLSAIVTPSFEADRQADSALARPSSTTGFMLGLGPAFAF